MMTVQKIFAALLALILMFSAGGCKSRNSGKEDKPKGARENVVVSENPRTEENRLEPSSSQSSEEEEESSEPETDPVPEEMASAFLGAVKSGVRENIQAFTDYNAMFNLAEGQGADWLLRQVLLRLNYEIISADVGENKAVITAKVSNIDMNTVLPLYFEQAMAVSFENASEGLGKTQEELDAEYRKVFVDLLTKYEGSRIDRITDIALEKTGEEWKLVAGQEFGNVMLGGFLEAQDRVRGDMQQSAADEAPAASQAAEEDDYDAAGDGGEYTDIDLD